MSLLNDGTTDDSIGDFLISFIRQISNSLISNLFILENYVVVKEVDSSDELIESEEDNESYHLEIIPNENDEHVFYTIDTPPKKKKIKKLRKKSVKRQPLSAVQKKGYTLLKARSTVDNLTQKLSRFKQGFEIPASVAKKIKQRRLTHWADNNEEICDVNDESFVAHAENDNLEPIQECTKTIKQASKRKSSTQVLNVAENSFDGEQNMHPKRQRKTLKSAEKPAASTGSQVVNTQSSSENVQDRCSFWNVKGNSISAYLFEYFEVKSQSLDKSKLHVKCKICPPDKDLLSCVNGNNSNLKSHIESVRIWHFVNWNLYFRKV